MISGLHSSKNGTKLSAQSSVHDSGMPLLPHPLPSAQQAAFIASARVVKVSMVQSSWLAKSWSVLWRCDCTRLHVAQPSPGP